MHEPRLVENSGGKWLELSWPVLCIFAILGGGMLASRTSYASLGDAFDAFQNAFMHKRDEVAPCGGVLVITNNPAHQLQVVATLSPRGFQPMLANSLKQVMPLLASHSPAVRMAVVDTTLPDAAAILNALRAVIPPNRIVRLGPANRQETIAPMLLDRL